MSRHLVLVILVAMTSHSISGVILRPNWFPYFRNAGNKANMAEYRDSNSGNNEPIAYRQARNSQDAVSMDSPCQRSGDIANQECLRRMLRIISSVLDRKLLSKEKYNLY